ncbi:NAD-dependent malic enzyme [Candidatus Woesearchaeota archaeon]|nr:NAD-dependent malic enzyme [Candidatus Woesearchaeota archaeon]
MAGTSNKSDYKELALKMHEDNKGKISVVSKVSLKTKDDLSIAYTPGVAEPCVRISKNKDDVYKYTSKGNIVAVVSDGTAVLGLGDIGPEAALPVMEGKAILFKEFGGVDAFPIVLATKKVDEIVQAVKMIAPGFGGINLEDISSPRCFEVEEKLKKELEIPVFHDDQHGTAIVVLAGLTNALKLAGKKFSDIKVVFSGAGAAGIAIIKLLRTRGVSHIIATDRAGAIYEGRLENMNPEKEMLAKITNKEKLRGSLGDVINGADVFVGVSSAGLLTAEMVKSMAPKAIIFAMANPTPEIMPDEAKEAGAFIVATGRSDYPNQVNNVLAFPGVFRGALDVRARNINEEMKLAAADAIAGIVINPSPDMIIPGPFTSGLAGKVAEAVKKAAVKSGVNRI